MSKGKKLISNKQFRNILICIMWPATINYGSGILARNIGCDMWISGIISVFTVLPFIVIIIHIGQEFPGKTIAEYSTNLLGGILGKALGMVLAIYFFIATSSSITMYVHHLTGFLLPQTPFLVVTVLHVFVICCLVWKGPEVIARTSNVAFGMAVIFYLLVFMASLSEINIDRITPIFDSGIVPVFKSSLNTDTFIGISSVLVGMLLPMVNDQKKAIGTAISGLFIGGFFLFSILLLN